MERGEGSVQSGERRGKCSVWEEDREGFRVRRGRYEIKNGRVTNIL